MKIVTIKNGELEQSEVQALKILAKTYEECDGLLCCNCPLNIVSEYNCVGSESLDVLKRNKLV